MPTDFAAASRPNPVREVIILFALFAAATLVTAYIIYPAMGWPAFSPMPARSILLAVVIVLMVRASSDGLAVLGMARPRFIWLTLVLALVFIALKIFLFQPTIDILRDWLSIPPSNHSAFAHIQGDLPMYVSWLVIAWAAGGFAEEIIFRGYLIGRVSAALGNKTWAVWLMVIVQALLFGAAHAYQGPGGMVSITVSALFSGIFFVIVGRNLWVMILAHGVWDTLGLTLIYLSGSPSTS